jgi:hypothetical protein
MATEQQLTQVLPQLPLEVVVEFVLPHAFDSFARALDLMLLCRAAHQFATTRRLFWESFLWRRLEEVVIPWLEAAYHRYAPPLINLLRKCVCCRVCRVSCAVCRVVPLTAHGIPHRAGSM